MTLDPNAIKNEQLGVLGTECKKLIFIAVIIIISQTAVSFNKSVPSKWILMAMIGALISRPSKIHSFFHIWIFLHPWHFVLNPTNNQTVFSLFCQSSKTLRIKLTQKRMKQNTEMILCKHWNTVCYLSCFCWFILMSFDQRFFKNM